MLSLFKRFFLIVSLFIRKIYNSIYYCAVGNDKFIVINAWLIQWGNKITPRNFGDDLNFYLISELSGKKSLLLVIFFIVEKC